MTPMQLERSRIPNMASGHRSVEQPAENGINLPSDKRCSSTVNLEERIMYQNLLKQCTPGSSSRLSNGSSYHSLTGSHRSALDIVDLTSENKTRLSSSRLASPNIEKSIELSDSEEDVVEVLPPKKVNSLKKSLESPPLFSSQWIDDL